MDLPFKQIIHYNFATEAYTLTHSQILFKHKNLLLCYVLRFLFCIELWYIN